MTDNNTYQLLQPAARHYLLLLVALLLLVIAGGYCAWHLEHSGHVISGMNNRVVWGLPHVFAISLIVAASGALNGATLASVFGVSVYKPWARLSVVLAIVLLLGGLVVLVLDLGRPDRLLIAMTTYNFRSIFSWNIFLYTGFIVIGIVYLWMMFERRFNKHTSTAGVIAFAWRIVLTSGTGAIFGFLVGRSALDSAILPPLFVAISFVMGSAVLVLVMMLVARLQQTTLSLDLQQSFCKLIFWCLLVLLYFSVVHHLTNLYVVQHHSDEKFVLAGPHAVLFWLGHIGLGVLLPLFLLRRNFRKNRSADNDQKSSQPALLWACCSAIVGGMVLLYVIVVGSQRTPQQLFPGKTVIASSFGDAGIAPYLPSLWEWGLGLGGVSLSLLLLFFVLRVLPVSPQPSIS